jgi:hypothetical protein
MFARQKLPPRRQTLETVNIPAPLGGINTVSAGSAMPATDAIYCWNMIPSELGLRSRLGYREWCIGLGDTVRSVLPFTGSAESGAGDKLFAVTPQGIWDVSAASASPTQLVTFDIQDGDAGYGTAAAFTTPAGRFLLYTDEENGLYVWSESGAAWSKVLAGVTQLWAASTGYAAGNRVVNNGNVYVATAPGTSAVSSGPSGTGSGIADGSVLWNYVSAAESGVIGPSLADQNLAREADPEDFVHVAVWKNRVWFTERDTDRAYYLDVNSLFGTATSFSFGPKMRAGGHLVGLFNWSYDGGAGLDTLLVGISGGGDVVIYQGTDPSSASTFGLKGCWFVGAVPAGRQIATDYGGDLLVQSLIGVVPLSKLVVGGDEVDTKVYATAKIANLFNQLSSTRRTLRGWAMHIHPTDNALLVLVPTDGVNATEPLVMSFATRGWSRYREIPIFSGAVWAGDFWFGTADGRVCRNVDYFDGVPLIEAEGVWEPLTLYDAGDRVIDPIFNTHIYECVVPGTSTEVVDAFTDYPEEVIDGEMTWRLVGLTAGQNAPVKWSVLTAYQSDARFKSVRQLRPIILSGSPTPIVDAKARYGFDLTEPDAPSGTPSGGWDEGLWDEAVWSPEIVPYAPLIGATGCGRDVAIALRGSATSRTVLVGVDVWFEQGGS